MLVCFSANTRRPSKTHALAQAIQDAVGPAFGPSVLFDLTQTARDFGAALGAAELPGAAAHMLRSIETAEALIVVSPVYKGSYSGLFKHVFDMVDPDALYGKPAILAATGGGARHALMVEHQMRPLFGFFRARATATAVYASDGDFRDGRLADPGVRARIAAAAGELAAARHPIPRDSQQDPPRSP